MVTDSSKLVQELHGRPLLCTSSSLPKAAGKPPEECNAIVLPNLGIIREKKSMQVVTCKGPSLGHIAKLSQQAQSFWPVKLVLKIVFSIDSTMLTLEQHKHLQQHSQTVFQGCYMMHFRDAVRHTILHGRPSS